MQEFFTSPLKNGWVHMLKHANSTGVKCLHTDCTSSSTRPLESCQNLFFSKKSTSLNMHWQSSFQRNKEEKQVHRKPSPASLCFSITDYQRLEAFLTHIHHLACSDIEDYCWPWWSKKPYSSDRNLHSAARVSTKCISLLHCGVWQKAPILQ